VSHRWQGPAEPDPGAEQLREIIGYLQKHSEIRYVWYDFWCMPQDERSEEQLQEEGTVDSRTESQKAEFKRMLKMINYLYLGCRVLVLLDLGYMSRFWTLFESWLAMRKATEHGLVEAHSDDERERQFCIKVLYDNPAASELIEALLKQWRFCTWSDAKERLASVDIAVTNASDKEYHLKNLGGFHRSVGTKLSQLRDDLGEAPFLAPLSGLARVTRSISAIFGRSAQHSTGADPRGVSRTSSSDEYDSEVVRRSSYKASKVALA